jgi:hypothetical protein
MPALRSRGGRLTTARGVILAGAAAVAAVICAAAWVGCQSAGSLGYVSGDVTESPTPDIDNSTLIPSGTSTGDVGGGSTNTGGGTSGGGTSGGTGGGGTGGGGGGGTGGGGGGTGGGGTGGGDTDTGIGIESYVYTQTITDASSQILFTSDARTDSTPYVGVQVFITDADGVMTSATTDSDGMWYYYPTTASAVTIDVATPEGIPLLRNQYVSLSSTEHTVWPATDLVVTIESVTDPVDVTIE